MIELQLRQVWTPKFPNSREISEYHVQSLLLGDVQNLLSETRCSLAGSFLFRSCQTRRA